MSIKRIIPSELEGDALWQHNAEYVLADEYEKIEAENKRLREAMAEIAKPTYGTEFSDTDAERAEHYWALVSRFQYIARTALKGGEG